MCAFCAAIPVSVALGASAKSRQKQAALQMEADGKKNNRLVIPAGKVTAVVVTGLVVCSVIYHTHFNSLL